MFGRYISEPSMVHPADCHPIFGNDGILYYTRRLTYISNLHTGIFGLIPLSQLLCCILWAYGLAVWLEINILLYTSSGT